MEAGLALDDQGGGVVSVPGEVSVIGFDGIAFADYVEPTLTTFRQPRQAIGREGAGLLLRAMAGETVREQIRLAVPLVARASTGVAPK